MRDPEVSTITAVKGTQQSPINLQWKQVIDAHLGSVVLDYPDPIIGRFIIEDEEKHTHAQFKVENGKADNLVFAGHSAKLVAIHFHSPSEHLIDGQRFATEFHFVHDIVHYPEETKSLSEPSLKLVIGFFAKAKEPSQSCESETPTNQFAFATRLNRFLSAQKERKVDDKCEPVDLPNDLPKLIQEACHDFFYYRGSLTSASYDEVVTWLVLPNEIETEGSFLEAIKNTKQTTRLPQLLNRRIVLRSTTAADLKTARSSD
jgi:carbonic anhydrase